MKIARLVGLVALTGALALGGFASWDGQVAHGYKYKKYKKTKKTSYTATCNKENCGRTQLRTCLTCAANDRTNALNDCKAALQAATTPECDRGCRTQNKHAFALCRSGAKKQFKAEKRTCQNQKKSCHKCCGQNGGENDCSGYFDSECGGYSGSSRAASRRGFASKAFLRQPVGIELWRRVRALAGR